MASASACSATIAESPALDALASSEEPPPFFEQSSTDVRTEEPEQVPFMPAPEQPPALVDVDLEI
eukprot:10551994-Alexandrium_andersonii.AAC.1